MCLGKDISKLQISAWAGSAITVKIFNGIDEFALSHEEVEQIFGTILSNKFLQDCQKINFPKKRKYDEGGCDGFAWELTVNDNKYEGYLIEPKFIKQIKKIFNFENVWNYAKKKLELKNGLKTAQKFLAKKEDKMENKVKLVPSMKEKVEGDGAWCASFALAWREFEKVVLEGDFEYKGESELVKNLIEQCKKNIEVSEKDCYVKSGKMTVALKKEIEKAIKKKFDTKSDILDSLEFSKDEKTSNILVYAIIMFMLEFPEEFDIYDEELPFGEGDFESLEKTKYFGIIRGRRRKELYNQVEPLFYNTDNDFALSLDSKDGKKVVLYRTNDEENFDIMYERILEKANQNNNNFEIGDIAIPNLKLDLLNMFVIEGEFLNKKDGFPYKVSKAMQTLKFELNSKGAKVKSEAAMMIEKASFRPRVEYRNFYFTNKFYLYIVDNDNPIVAMRVNDIKKFK